MILDVYDSLYVWVGRGANETEKKEALRVAQVTTYMRIKWTILRLFTSTGVRQDGSIRA